ncbi:MAG: hypothetical protein GWO24_07730 [Akkermansiaceae bacterium]|nr:hypothetical protein [Akkermansiaceae bacterium]
MAFGEAVRRPTVVRPRINSVERREMADRHTSRVASSVGAVEVAGPDAESRGGFLDLAAGTEGENHADVEVLQGGEVDHQLGLLRRTENGAVHSHDEGASPELRDVVENASEIGDGHAVFSGGRLLDSVVEGRLSRAT